MQITSDAFRLSNTEPPPAAPPPSLRTAQAQLGQMTQKATAGVA